MFYGDYDDFSSHSSAKTIKVYKNGDMSVSLDLKLTSDFKVKEITDIIETKLKLKPVQKLRLFTSEGLEISPEELNYIKDGESLFASRGENFDRSSTLSEYEIIKQLGEGGFGEVVMAVHKRTKEKVAIKFLKANARGMANEIDRQFAEAETLKNLHHKNIVRVLNCFSLSNMQVAFVMEYLEGGELFEYVSKNGKLSEDEAREFFKQIAEAVAYCHRNKFIHCDLKLENILLESKDSKVVKVVDFGISGIASNLQSEADGGSLDYMAPEYFGGSTKSVHPGVDIWALGCMLYAMVNGKLPFCESSESKIVERIRSGRVEYDENGKKLSKEIRNMISKMLEVDPEQRVTVYDVLDHPWMKNEKLPEDSSGEEEEEKNESVRKPLSGPPSSKKPASRQSYNFNTKAPSPSTRKSAQFTLPEKSTFKNSPIGNTAGKSDTKTAKK